MRTEVARGLWRPVGVEGLEPAADAAVRAGENTLVVAGPGSGKTELLAQRACFLLQTGTCADPRRILAISFKRDAARNLRDRVQRRCGRDLAHRFDSYTFDSFSKGLVDRFLAALPQPFRPAADYRVLVGKDFNERRMMDLVRHMPSDLSAAALNSLNAVAVWRAFLGRPLPIDGEWENRGDEERAAAGLWRHLLHDGGSAVGFPMLGRLAELLLRSNPQVLAAMRKSYAFLFLDEFQDTTAIHYALVRTAFEDSNTILTAVGDDKQRIMGWAGALKNVLRQFENDFGATRVPLERNYRSAPRLVKIQSVVAKALDPKAVEAVAMDDGEGGNGECEVLTFEDDREEAKHLAAQIANWISNDGLRPRDICVLCRMKPPVYTEQLRGALAKRGVRSRIENELQDLLAEPLTEALLDMMKLACRNAAPEAWGRTVALLGDVGGDDDEAAMSKVVDRLLAYTRKLKSQLAARSATEAEIEPLLRNIMRFVGEADFKALNPQYLQGTWYDDTIKALSKAMAEARRGRDWSEALDELEGVDSVPIMTTHKSKGLEYHTIIFVGLEDSAHFNFTANPAEETCGFFVALSRAMKRAIFTYGGKRPTGKSGLYVIQEREELAPLYALLEKAGIPVPDQT